MFSNKNKSIDTSIDTSMDTSTDNEDYKVYSYKPQPYMKGTLILFVIILLLIIIINWLFSCN